MSGASMSKKTRKELKATIREQRIYIEELEDNAADLVMEIGMLNESDIRHRLDDAIFEAEGRKMEGREFGPWLLKRVRRFVAYG